MGDFDAAGVIKAAATSNLGVVSLIVLVLAFLAWRFFQRSADRVKLIAFAMMFLGAAGFVAAVMLAGGDGDAPILTPVQTPAAASPVERASPSATAETPNIAGAWHDDEGYRYTFIQDGSTFSYAMLRDGTQVGRGVGTIAGTHLRYRYVDDGSGNEGTCEADVAADAKAIKGSCTDGTTTWAFVIAR